MAETTDKPVIFLAFANDLDDSSRYLRNLAHEKRKLRDELETPEQAGLCEVVVRSNCTVDDIFKVFQSTRYRNRIAIFHYGGHANGYELLLESAPDVSGVANAGGLAAFVALQQGLQLVFLNGCSTQQQTEGLVAAGVPAIISTSRSIDDKVATEFSAQFYRGLASRDTISSSFRKAQAKIQTLKGSNKRALSAVSADLDSEIEEWPWNLHQDDDSNAGEWSLAAAAADPLFGLPPLPDQDLPDSPYRHLNWFTREDSDVFFGRGRQIRDLYDRLTAPRAAPIMMIYGQSGVGKSSVLDAGLIPRLESDYEVRCLRRTQGGLLDTLRLALMPESAESPVETAWRLKEEKSCRPLLIILDQAEEVFNPAMQRPGELECFLKALTEIFQDPKLRPNGKLILGFRKEWLAELDSKFGEHQLPRSKVFLEPLDRDGIIEVVNGPVSRGRLRQKYGLTVEAGVAEAIADDLLADRDSSIAPTLQILLTKMWSKATERNYAAPKFDLHLYYQLKREGILLGDFLDQQICAFSEKFPDMEHSGLLLDVLALHTTPLGTADQRSIAKLEQHYAHVRDQTSTLLQQCQDLQLLTVTTAPGRESDKFTRLVHDTLAPLVRERFEESDKPGQRSRRILDNRSVDWAKGREVPLDDVDLNIVELGISGTRDLNSTEKRLLDASRQLRDRLNRSRRIMRIAVGLMMVMILVGAGVAEYLRRNAITEATEAERIKSFFQYHLNSERVSQFGQVYEDVRPEVANLEIRDQINRAEIHNQLGNVFVKLANVEKAEDKQNESLKILEAVPDSDRRSHEIAVIKTNLTLLRTIEGRYDEALELVNQALSRMRSLGLNEYEEPMYSATMLRCLALNGSRDRWDEPRRRANQKETDQTLKRLQRNQQSVSNDESRQLQAALKVVRALMKLDHAGNPRTPIVDRVFKALAGRNLIESARSDLKDFPEDPTRLGIEAYDVLLPYYVDHHILPDFNWLRHMTTEVSNDHTFIVESDRAIDRLGRTFGHSNPGILNIQLVRAQIVNDVREQDRLFVSLLDRTRKVLGTKPAYARFVYAYTDFLDHLAESQDDELRQNTYDRINFYLSDIVARMSKGVESRKGDADNTEPKPVYRLGYAHLRLGRALTRRAMTTQSDHQKAALEEMAQAEYERAWKLFVADEVQNFSELGGQPEFDRIRSGQKPTTVSTKR